jgi:GTP-binding protein EngB required for normal cell division
MTAMLTAQVSEGAERAGLSARLTALSRLVQIGAARTGTDGFGEDLLTEASELLARAGQRLMLSSRHTVVSLAGGTGSGKSSLFNQLAGADFSSVGVTRPVTRAAHACVWGVSGSGPLLEWLGVPARHRYARASALGGGEQSMSGLVLLDLPDHDSVMGHATHEVDHLVGLSDLIVWVLDPQKYADAAVHRRFLVPLAGHSEVIAVVLNQADLLTAGQIEDCVTDLRRLLDSEGLHDVQILVTSAKTGAGVEELRKLLIEAATARTAATARISADVDKVVAKFEPYGATEPAAAGDSPEPGDLHQEHVRPGTAPELAADFAKAAGVAAIRDALRSARELRALDYVGWPVSWLAERLTSRDPVRKVRLGKLWDELRGVRAGPSGAQQAEVDNALTRVADENIPALPSPWSRTVRAAVRSRAAEVPAAIGEQIGAALPGGAVVDRWWRLIGMVQGLLLGCVLVGIVWFAALITLGVAHVGSGIPRLFSDAWLLPWAALMVIGGMLGGWLTARACTRAVSKSAELATEEVADDIRRRLEGVASEMVLAPAESELDELQRFRAQLRAAAGYGLVRAEPGWPASI